MMGPGFAAEAFSGTVRWIVIIIATASMGGFWMGVAAGYMMWKTEPCPKVQPQPKPVAFKEMTKKQAARWQQWRENESRGWVIK